MTTIPPTSPTAASAATTPTNPSSVLGKDDFLKLMIAQLKYQDPMKPTDTSAYLGQLAQFTELEQVTNMAKSSQQAAVDQRTAQTLALLGHTVTYVNAAGAKVTGAVQSVQLTSAGATLTVAGSAGVDPTTVTQVA
jgi:flagellar basal-body rod modification protein FlgD